MSYRIDEAELVQALDRRVVPTLPTEWPGADAWPVRSSSVGSHFDYLDSLKLDELPRAEVLAALVESANDALAQRLVGGTARRIISVAGLADHPGRG